MRVGGYLEPSRGILGDFGCHLGLAKVLLKLFWTISDALTPRGEARSDPGRGGEYKLPEQGKRLEKETL
eukprot:8758807-Pyramimonas_sp.AAC.1